MSVLHSDSGVGADANPIGGVYVTIGAWGDLQRVGNQIGNASGSNTDSGAYINITTPDDHYCQFEIAVLGGADAGPMVRVQTGAVSGVLITGYIGNQVEAYVVVAGSFGSFVDRDAGTYAVGKVIYLEAQGNNYVSKIDGATVNSFSNATFSSGKAGLFPYDGTLRLTNVEVGDFSAGDTLIGQFIT